MVFCILIFPASADSVENKCSYFGKIESFASQQNILYDGKQMVSPWGTCLLGRMEGLLVLSVRKELLPMPFSTSMSAR